MSTRPYRIRKARQLLAPGVPRAGGVWADLGCGDGIFTAALYSLVGEEARIYAVDRNRSALRSLEIEFAGDYPQAQVTSLQADFTQPLDLPLLDGIVMANALHFVRRKEPVVEKIVTLLKPGGRLIVVEYNTARGNFAVPHPLDEAGFLRLAGEIGLREAQIISRIPSSFLGEMYAGMGLAG